MAVVEVPLYAKPEVPLLPEVPLVPLDPLDPLVPLVPLVPDVPDTEPKEIVQSLKVPLPPIIVTPTTNVVLE